MIKGIKTKPRITWIDAREFEIDYVAGTMILGVLVRLIAERKRVFW